MFTKYDENKIFYKEENGVLVGGGHLVSTSSEYKLNQFIAFNNKQEALLYYGITEVENDTNN